MLLQKKKSFGLEEEGKKNSNVQPEKTLSMGNCLVLSHNEKARMGPKKKLHHRPHQNVNTVARIVRVAPAIKKFP